MERLLGHRGPKGPATDKPTSCCYRATSRLYRPRSAFAFRGDLSLNLLVVGSRACTQFDKMSATGPGVQSLECVRVRAKRNLRG